VKKVFLHFSFWIPAALFIGHQIMQKIIEIQFSPFDLYLDPFCFSAIAISLWTLERKLLFNQSTISKLEVRMLVLFLILYSEFFLPYFFPQFVFDLWDVVMILLGYFWFYLFKNKLIKYFFGVSEMSSKLK
tara:strand:- start:1641 stop:2033 length:393 start_codon:yes stop_codon:yes gene_type:complete